MGRFVGFPALVFPRGIYCYLLSVCGVRGYAEFYSALVSNASGEDCPEGSELRQSKCSPISSLLSHGEAPKSLRLGSTPMLTRSPRTDLGLCQRIPGDAWQKKSAQDSADFSERW